LPHADLRRHPPAHDALGAARPAGRRERALARPDVAGRGRAMTLLEVAGLTKRYAGLTALDAVSFTVKEGEILGLFGPNGAGKTTCFHCLSGFAVPDGGRVLFDGRDITGRPPHRLAQAGIARTFQIVRPFRNLTVLDNVLVALGHRRYE